MAELNKQKLIAEEQKIIDKLIDTIEREIQDADIRLKSIIKTYHEAKKNDSHDDIAKSLNEKKIVLNSLEKVQQSKDALYTCRLILECDDGDNKTSDIELKIGLSTYIGKNGEIHICDWRRKVCRHFLLDNCTEEYDGYKKDRCGIEYKTHYTLKLKRIVDTHFSHVRDVTHLFPLIGEEAEQIIYDAFLSELANRRANTEFKNIIFSIQKKQGEIIKLPYNQDMIVQGCAGSGKSMIMLHRLPILIYNYLDKLNNKNMYIISPSETYIQMADNMREELEITDLKMGTLNQYYDYVLSKYNINLELYGHISYTTKIPKENEEYIYSKALSDDIQKIALDLINIKNHDFNESLTILGLPQRNSTYSTTDALITDYILIGTNIINVNNAILKEYFMICKSCISCIKDIVKLMKNRRKYTLNKIDKEIDKQKKIIKQKQKELKDTSLNETKVKNREIAINLAQNKILEYQNIRQQVLTDDEYFDQFPKYCTNLDEQIAIFNKLKSQYEYNSKGDIYNLLQSRKAIYKGYKNFLNSICSVEHKYTDFNDNMFIYAKKSESQLSELLTKNELYLDLEYFDEIIETTKYYTKLRESIVQDIYLNIMQKCGQVPNEKGNLKGLLFSPYLYLKIMYLVKGSPNVAKEKLICIDEAQNLAAEELKLIKAINGDDLILNLYGDVKQHIEGTKGIDSWKEFSDCINVSEHLLMENYRNASQITEECNKRFGMKMEAINTPGSGVTEFKSKEDFEEQLHHIFVNVHKPGIRAIVVNDIYEAKQFKYQYAVYQDKIHDMTGEHFDFHRTRWNLLTVEQTKGLEFNTVITISSRMTPNKKYIAFTRALDELFIYDLPLNIDPEILTNSLNETNGSIVKTKNDAKSNKNKKTAAIIDYSKSEVRKYFEDKGLEVYDMRPKGGALWIVGEQSKIKQYVDEACEKFRISGSYSSGKTTGFRPGCYFKTKK